MKINFSFFKKYYGSIIGMIIGFLLLGTYYYFSEFHTPVGMSMLRVSETVETLVLPILTLVTIITGPLAIVLWLLGSIGVYILLTIHSIVTILVYGFIGFGIHYLFLKAERPGRVIIDKNKKI